MNGLATSHVWGLLVMSPPMGPRPGRPPVGPPSLGPHPSRSNALDGVPVLGQWLGRRTDATPAQIALWVATHPQRDRLIEVD